MKYPLRFRAQEWLAERVSWVQYPRQQFIHQKQKPASTGSLLDAICKWAFFTYAMAWIWGPVIVVLFILMVVYL
ncbi:hypothetical protein [Aquitalea magnusonii]|uniref:hypothetical protein n=1 Tax=Aquitalea magnusonii TaxID=332411 RepID=UPI00075027DD|nr:hypothetical protein [Aquitalea magnusonii]